MLWPTCDLWDASELLRNRDISSRELVEAHLNRLRMVEPTLRACITVLAEQAQASAVVADHRRDELGSDSLPLLGLPMAIKDNFETAGVRTTAGSPSLVDYVPSHDAVSVDRLRRAGLVFLAKANLDEFAFGGESSNPVGGTTLNPWDAKSIPGGSSGGSAAAVSAGMCMAATGSDTGGSIRNPAGWCGVVGFKPTFGAIDPAGLVPLAWSMDTVGFLARTTRDCALLFAETADTLVSASPLQRRCFFDSTQAPPRRRPVFAVASNLFEQCEKPVRLPFQKALEQLSRTADLEEVKIPRLDDALLADMIIESAEGAAAWESGLRNAGEQYGIPVRAALDVGRLLLATDYIHAQRVREGIRREVLQFLAPYDATIMPTMGIDPRPGVFEGAAMGPSSPIWQLESKYTCIWNLTGSPVVAVPCAFTDSGRPVAMQIVTAPGKDQEALQLSRFAEQSWNIPRDSLVPSWVKEQLA